MDESVTEQENQAAAQGLVSMLRDSRENLNQKVQEDLNAEVVRYYFDAERGLYFEHGHVSDGALNNNPAVPAMVLASRLDRQTYLEPRRGYYS